jgi:sugar lactone lactonase YvrE
MRVRAPKIKSVSPGSGIEGGKVLIEGTGFDPEESSSTQVMFGGVAARLLLLSTTKILTQVPEEAKPGPVTIQIKNKTSNSFDFNIGERLATDLNPVDNPIYDPQGNLYVTFSGKRGETVPVSVYRISPEGEVKPHLSNIPNATSMAMDADGNLYVSSRFEGTVYKATPQADVTLFAKELGVPTGIAFDRSGFLFVGDRGGRILKISSDGEVTVFAEIPESMVAFHLAFDNDGNLLVSNPALSSRNQILMVDKYGKVIPLYGGFGRPQGLTVDQAGNIYVCEAKAGDSAVMRISKSGEISPVITGPVMVGLALDNKGNVAIAGQNSIYRLPLPVNGN